MNNKNKQIVKVQERIQIRKATEEDYKRLEGWSIGTLHRASILPKPQQTLKEESSLQEPTIDSDDSTAGKNG